MQVYGILLLGAVFLNCIYGFVLLLVTLAIDSSEVILLQIYFMGFTNIKPLNIVLLDTYVIALLYLIFTWQYVNCSTNSNIWQLFYYLILFGRLAIDELQNNRVITPKIYSILILVSSIILSAMSIFECVNIANNSSAFDREGNMACFQNRIVLVGQCVFAYLILIKDIVVICTSDQNQTGQEASNDNV